MTDTVSFRPFKRLLRMLERDKQDIYRVYLFALLIGIVNLSVPLGIQAIINLIQGGEISASWIVLVTIVTVGIGLTGYLQYYQLRIVENISQRIFSRSSFEFAFRFPRIQAQTLYNYHAPELANRFFDTLTIQKGLPKILIDFSLALFQIIAGILVLSMYHSFFIVFGLISIFLIYIIIALTGPQGLRTSLAESKLKYRVVHWIEEIARTRLSFKLSHEADIALTNTDSAVQGYLDYREKHFGVLVNQFFSLIGFKVLITAGLLVIGGILVFNQEMNIGQFVAAEIIILIIISSVEKVIQALDSIYDVLTALEKIGYVTDMPLDDNHGIEVYNLSEGINITLTDVNFSYPGSNTAILKDLSIDIPANKSTWITGPSGSGKSTLLQLVSGVYQPSNGVIKFNGFSTQSINFEQLRNKIGFALNNNQLFQGTILENITLGMDIPMPDILRSIKMVLLESFITQKPDGLQTHIDPDGVRLPKSVAHKIILARAIASQPRLLLLEDPLDQVLAAEKEIIIQNLMKKSNPWDIIVSSVDRTWSKYIDNTIILNPPTNPRN